MELLRGKRKIGRIPRSAIVDRRGPMYPKPSGKSGPNLHWKFATKKTF